MPCLRGRKNPNGPRGGLRWGRSVFCCGVLLAAMLALAGRLAYLQVANYDRFSNIRDKRRQTTDHIPPRRNSIVDACGRELALSVPVKSCALDPKGIDNPRQVLGALSGVLGLDEETSATLAKRAMRPGCRFLWIRRRLTETEAENIKTLKLPGVIIIEDWQRQYPQGSLAAQVIGFTDIDTFGREGIEASHDAILRGDDGTRQRQRDALSRPVYLDVSFPDQQDDAMRLQLTIDSVIQHIAEDTVAEIVKKHTPSRAAAIVMNPQNGDILAMVNWPTFDPNDPGAAEPESRYNFTTAGVYEPGSIFKPFTLSSAIDAGVVTTETPINCERGNWNLGFRVLHDVHGYGTISASMVVEKSSNIGIAKIALKLGPKSYYEYLHNFGFGQPTGVDIRGEMGGILRPLEQWNVKYSMTSIPMGHEISVTPLQISSAFSAIVNGGVLYRPRLVKGILDEKGHPLQSAPEVPLRRVISEKTSATMRDVLGRVVTNGTGKQCASKLYTIGGKTGTAQLSSGGNYSQGKYIGSFIACAPLTHPRIVVLVSVVEPHHGYYGGTVAAPFVKTIIERSLVYMEEPTLTGGSVACSTNGGY